MAQKMTPAQQREIHDALNTSEMSWHQAMDRVSEKYVAMRTAHVGELAALFAKYKTHPKSRFDGTSAARVFQKMFPNNHYSKDIGTFLQAQNYKPAQRGADMPWWGLNFFTDLPKRKVCIVAQDTNSKDAGSVALYAHLFQSVGGNRAIFREFEERLGTKRSFFSSWNAVREQLLAWDINLDDAYITDAKKVYAKGSWKDRDFDVERSKELLEAELRLCKPDLVILLGGSPLSLFAPDVRYADAVVAKEPPTLCGAKTVVAPFFIGNGRTQKDFRKRMKVATRHVLAP